MASWGEIERAAPELAREARTLLEAHVHKTIATLRADGEGIEENRGDAKLAGLAEEVTDLERKREIFKAMGAEEVPDDSALYRVDVRELALTRLTEAKDELAISWWTEAGGLREVTRK
jgi:hypothetical protein